MQSETQHIPGSKSPYLSQYRNDISAKQKLIRERLGSSGPSYSSVHDTRPMQRQQDKDNIPSIDDETIEQVSQEKHYRSKFSSNYIDDDEAEASLQFFKKNLLPASDNYKKPIHTAATGSHLFDSRPSQLSTGIGDSEPSSSRIISTTIERSGTTEPKSLSSKARYQPIFGSTSTKSQQMQTCPKPLPLKQTSLNEPKMTDRSSTHMEASTLREPIDYHTRQSYISSRLNAVERPPEEQQHLNNTKLTSNEPRQRSNKSKSSEIISSGNTIDQRRQQQSQTQHQPSPEYRTEPKVVDDISRRSIDSPSQNGTFTRKPLYNSLLRAHDSIRLKVNRPKVRPKSDVPVEDTVVDSIPIAEINTDLDPNERAIDVKRGSSKRKSKKKDKKNDEVEKLPMRNFSEIRVVKIERNETERSIGVTVKAENGNIVVARIMAGSLADKQGALQVGDIILSVDNREVYTPEQLQEQLRKTIAEDTVILKIVPSFREELPTLCIYLRALFTYDANEDSLLPCKEVGVSFNQGDILEVVNQEDPNWWQARRVDSEHLQTGLIPSQELEERRRAFVIPDYDLATRTSICGTKVSRKSKKKEVYNVGQNSDFDKAELQLYEEVCRTPAFERRTLVLIGANGVGKQAIKARLVSMDPERFGTPLPHTSRLPREGEEDGIHYHFVTREKMEEDIIDGKYLEYGEYDGALYGTKLDSVREIIGSGRICVLDCSATCLKILKSSDYLPFVAFIAAPTLDQLRFMNDWARAGTRNSNYTTFDRALSRHSRRAKTLQDFAFDFFEDEDLQVTVEESARLFRMYENYFDVVLVNSNFEKTFELLRDSVDALSMEPQWIPISWIYGT